MDSSGPLVHPEGEQEIVEDLKDFSVDSYAAKYHVQWDHDSKVTPLGQLPYFVQFLKMGERFDKWVDEWPLNFFSNNAPSKIGFGTDRVMRELESVNQSYLFKLKRSTKVVELFRKHHFKHNWTYLGQGWQAKAEQIQLHGWNRSREVVLIRRQQKKDQTLVLEQKTRAGYQLSHYGQNHRVDIQLVDTICTLG